MTRLAASLFSLVIVFAVLPAGFAGPACSRKYWKTTDCIQKCGSKWGYPGSMMGSDPWGAVMHKTGNTAAAWDAAVAEACGTTPENSSPGPAMADPSQASFSASSASSSTAVTSSFSITPVTTPAATPATTSATITSSTVSSSSFIKPSTTLNKVISESSSTPTEPTATTSSIPPPPPPPAPTSTTSTAQAPPKATPTTTTTPAPASTPASGGDSSSGGGSTSSSDISQYLTAHNTVRSQHGASPLTWSNDLASKAQQWANNCVFQHSGGSLGPFGENLAAGTGSSYNIQTAVQSWTNEVSEYDPGNPQPSHFTQVVWKATTQVGCAVQSCDGIFDPSFGKAQFYVCEYSPQGNVIGQFAQNVQV